MAAYGLSTTFKRRKYIKYDGLGESVLPKDPVSKGLKMLKDNQTALYGLGAGVVDVIDQGNEYGVQSNVGSFAKGALSGAAMGSTLGGPIGTGVGALVGGGISLMQNKKRASEQKEMEQQSAIRNKRLKDNFYAAKLQANPELVQGNQNGQYFEMGGELGKQNGGRTPIIVNNPNDPKLKAYNDSLSLYNKSKELRINTYKNSDFYNGSNYIFSPNDNKIYLGGGKSIKISKNEMNNRLKEDLQNAFNNSKNLNKNDIIRNNISKKALNAGILPIGNYNGEGYFPAFKKPMQPIIYQKDKPLTKGQIATQQQEINYQQPNVPLKPLELQLSVEKNTPTNYGVNWRDDDRPNGQQNQVKYFKNKQDFDDFIKRNGDGAYIEQAGDGSKAQATLRGNKYGLGGPLSEHYLLHKKTYGGSVVPKSSDGVEFQGNSHDEGGIKIPEMGVEVEGNETAKDNYVFSDKLGFAKLHKPILRAKGKIESKAPTPERINAINLLNEREKRLMNLQEMFKKKMNINQQQ